MSQSAQSPAVDSSRHTPLVLRYETNVESSWQLVLVGSGVAAAKGGRGQGEEDHDGGEHGDGVDCG